LINNGEEKNGLFIGKYPFAILGFLVLNVKSSFPVSKKTQNPTFLNFNFLPPDRVPC